MASLLGKIARRLGRFNPVTNLRYVLRLWSWWRQELAASARRRAEPRIAVAVDVGALWEPLTGVGWYLYRVLEGLAGRSDLALRLYGPDLYGGPPAHAPPPEGPAVEIVRRADPPADGTLLSILFNRLWGPAKRFVVPWWIARDGNQVVWAPNFFSPRRFWLAERRGAAMVAMIHDLGYRVVPWALREETLEELCSHMGRVWRTARFLLTGSHSVARELVEAGLVAEDRIRTARLAPAHPPRDLDAVGSDALPAGTPERFALFVSTLEPRKNVTGLIEAWRLLHQSADGAEETGEAPPTLVLCGRYGWKSDEIRRAVETAEDEGLLHHFGYVGEDELAALYSRALFLVFPSHYEGFGIPALEAAAAGIPQVLSDIPPLREVAGPGALYAPADEPERWAEAAAELARDGDLRDRLAAAGKEHAAQFDWRQTAELTAAAFRDAAGGTA